MNHFFSALLVSIFMSVVAHAGVSSSLKNSSFDFSKPTKIQVSISGTGDGAGLPNPSSVVCKQVGGHLLTVEDSAGQEGVCQFDWGIIDEWTLYNKVTGQKSLAVNAFLNRTYEPGTGAHITWADSFCRKVGGKVKVMTETFRPTVEQRFCSFSDHSLIEEWTLFMGPQYAIDLANVLNNVTFEFKP